MPARAGRVRSRSESRANAATRNSGDPPSESDSGELARAHDDPLSDSGSEAGRPPNSGRVLYVCPGCNKSFGSVTSLRRHRNSRWMTNPACRNGGLKRPKMVRQAGDSARDADGLIRQTMGDIRPPSGADANPSLQSRDEVCKSCYTQFGLLLVCTRIILVCTRFVIGLYLIYIGLHLVHSLTYLRSHCICNKFALVLLLVCTIPSSWIQPALT